jgi:hypothetical protein
MSRGTLQPMTSATLGQRRVIQALRAPGAYHDPHLADEMERELASG